MRILTALLAAVATLAPAAGALGGTVGVDVGDLVGSRWHLVTDYINGIGGGCDPDTGICLVQGTYITVRPDGARFDVAMEWQVVPPSPHLRNWVQWNGSPFDYPTSPDFVRQFIRPRALSDVSTLGNAVMPRSAPARQPVLSCSEHDVKGSLTYHPRINLARLWWGYTGCDELHRLPRRRGD